MEHPEPKCLRVPHLVITMRDLNIYMLFPGYFNLENQPGYFSAGKSSVVAASPTP